MSQSQLFLIDAHALCYRSFYAIKGLTNSRGQATNAVFGFVKTLQKILQEYHPEYLAVCFDTKARTHRAEKYAEYKIQRPRMPDDLISQIPIIKNVVKAYGLPLFELDGYEADDLIAAIVKKITGRIDELVIVSDDKDMFQLVGGSVKLFSIRQDKILDAQEVREKLGFEPGLMADFIGLAGDQSDNIPGVNGVGEVTARKLICEYGGLEKILAHADAIKPESLSRKLSEQREQARLSRELALLDDNVALKISETDLKIGSPDQNKLLEYFNELEFRGLAAQAAGQTAAGKSSEVKIVSADQKAQDIGEQIRKAGQVAFLLPVQSEESTPLFSNHPKTCWLSWRAGEAAEIPLDSKDKLAKIMSDPGIRKVTYGLKNQLAVWPELSELLNGEIFDVMLAGYLVLPARADYSVQVLAWEFLKAALTADAKPEEIVTSIRSVYDPLAERLKKEGLWDLLSDVEIPLTFVLSRMEKEGVRIDEELLNKLSSDCEKKIGALMKDIYRLAEGEFNLNSPKQLSQVLFEKLKLPTVKKTKTGFSTNEEVLQKLADKHPIPAMILEYRQLAKLKSTYINALPLLINPKTGRVHATFNQAGTETGRLSSNNPNLQNIPIRTELGRQIRKAFIAFKSGHELIAADYSQIELRILAHLSKDSNLVQAFKDGHDIHNSTAAQIFDVKETDVTAEMRNSAKRVNFGIIYGMSAFGLAKDLSIPQPQAQDFIDRYFLRFPGVKKFMDDTIRQCEKQGYVVTLLNRRRYLPEIHSSNPAIQQFAQRQAINTPVQGSAADLIKLAMIRIDAEMNQKKMKSRMIITVHDELVFDAPKDEQGPLIELIRQKMESALTLNVPITVSIKHGPNWLDMTKV